MPHGNRSSANLTEAELKAKKQSESTERQLEDDAKQDQQVKKLLLLGAGESGALFCSKRPFFSSHFPLLGQV